MRAQYPKMRIWPILLIKSDLTDTERLISELTRSDSCVLTPIGTPCVSTMFADRQGVPIALTQFCPYSNLL